MLDNKAIEVVEEYKRWMWLLFDIGIISGITMNLSAYKHKKGLYQSDIVLYILLKYFYPQKKSTINCAVNILRNIVNGYTVE